MLLRFIVSAEANHFATFEKRLSVAHQWGFDGLRNQVVSKLNVGARFGVIKQVQVVFAVGRGDGALVTHVGQPVVKPFEFASLQVIAARENHAVISW